MGKRERLKQALAFARKADEDAAAVGGVSLALEQAGLRATVAELERRVGAKAETPCQVADGDGNVFSRAGHLEHELVLLRL